MKKWITVLLSLMMVLSLAACGGADDEGGMENEDSTVEAEEDAAEELESVKSAGGMIEVTPLEDWEVDIYSSCEDMIIRAPGTEEGTGMIRLKLPAVTRRLAARKILSDGSREQVIRWLT